jgi:alkanesulfonate monooxygenase SsuD/methylene tetrahydromethanopterin reductase-like flavin-dependent oxidoreductase (luciferase family)
VTVLSAADPVRVFQDFATIDLISRGRAEIIAGRGSFGEAFPLFGFRAQDYDALFQEKLDLLLKLRDDKLVTWRGQFRAPLDGQHIYPRPFQEAMPIWIGVGGTPQSFIRAGQLGLPLMVGIIGGSFEQFRPLVDLYRAAGRQAGHAPEKLKLGIHAFGFVADSDEAARNAFFPGWAYLLGERGRERGWSASTRARFDALCSPGGSYLVGSPDTIVRKLLAAAETFGDVSRFTFQMSCALLETQAMQRSIELLGTDVAPRFREALHR